MVEHIEDECAAQDITDILLAVGHGKPVDNPEALGPCCGRYSRRCAATSPSNWSTCFRSRRTRYARPQRGGRTKQVPEKCHTVFRRKPATKQKAKQAKRGRSHASLLRACLPIDVCPDSRIPFITLIRPRCARPPSRLEGASWSTILLILLHKEFSASSFQAVFFVTEDLGILPDRRRRFNAFHDGRACSVLTGRRPKVSRMGTFERRGRERDPGPNAPRAPGGRRGLACGGATR